MADTNTTCPAALSISGQHYSCDMNEPHLGLAHSSILAAAIWTDDPAVLRAAWSSAEKAGR